MSDQSQFAQLAELAAEDPAFVLLIGGPAFAASVPGRANNGDG